MRFVALVRYIKRQIAHSIGRRAFQGRLGRLPPRISTSFGHLSAKASARPVTATQASCKASDITNDRNAARPGGPAVGITSVAAKFPAGIAQGRPRRPRAAVCSSARIHSGPANSGAIRAASLNVESTERKTRRP